MVIKTETAESAGGGSWEGKLNTLKWSLEESSDSHIEHLRKLNTNLDKLLVIALEEKIRPIEEKINNKMQQLDGWIMSILNRLTAYSSK